MARLARGSSPLRSLREILMLSGLMMVLLSFFTFFLSEVPGEGKMVWEGRGGAKEGGKSRIFSGKLQTIWCCASEHPALLLSQGQQQ